MTTTKTSAVDPTVSIVMTIVDGGLTLRNALTAIAASANPPPLDVIVPFDNSVGEVATFTREFPGVHFLAMGQVATDHPIQSDSGQHELFDQRRAAGLAAAKGEIITILEDRGQVHHEWARNVVRVHAEKPNYVIGGAVELRTPAPILNWAVYMCDFSRYGLPLPKHPVEWVTDVNVSYKRAAIEETRHLWAKKYQEPVVHWALRNAGQELIFSDDLVVEHHRHLKGRFLFLLAEKFSWGRLFGEIRVRDMGLAERLKLIVMGPVIPFVLLLRHGKTQTSKGRFWRFLIAAPLLLILLIAWTAGEVWGYVTKKA